MKKVVLKGDFQREAQEEKQDERDETELDAYQEKNQLPAEIIAIMLPAIQVGALSGVSGVFVGAFAGVARTSTPKLFAVASGIQWFTLGTTYWASRGFIYKAWGEEKLTERNKISASALSGGIAGLSGGLLRGPRNVIPGAIMFALFGAAGQKVYSMSEARKAVASEISPEPKKTSWLDSKWSPMRLLSDTEYESMLQERLLRVNAEIALVDEHIEALQAQERELASKQDEPKAETETKER